MQMITAVATVANHGILMKPYIVHQRVSKDEPNGRNIVTEVEPEAVRNPVSKEAAAILTDMLVAAVDRKAPEAKVPGYRIAGKTGIAYDSAPDMSPRAPKLGTVLVAAPQLTSSRRAVAPRSLKQHPRLTMC